MLVKNVRRRLSRPRSCGGISQAKTGSSAKASASTSPSRAASSRRAARTAWEPPREATVSWATPGLLRPAVLDRPQALMQIAPEDRLAGYGHDRGPEPPPHAAALAHDNQVDVRSAVRAGGEAVYPAALR